MADKGQSIFPATSSVCFLVKESHFAITCIFLEINFLFFFRLFSCICSVIFLRSLQIENPRSDEMHKLMAEFRQLYKEKLQRLEERTIDDSAETQKVNVMLQSLVIFN